MKHNNTRALIQRLRMSAKLTQKQLAHLSEISQQVISKIEVGHACLRPHHARALAPHLGISAAGLLGVGDDPQDASTGGAVPLRGIVGMGGAVMFNGKGELLPAMPGLSATAVGLQVFGSGQQGANLSHDDLLYLDGPIPSEQARGLKVLVELGDGRGAFGLLCDGPRDSIQIVALGSPVIHMADTERPCWVLRHQRFAQAA